MLRLFLLLVEIKVVVSLLRRGDLCALTVGSMDIVDKCFKLHGYPLGYKPTSKASSSFVNQVVADVLPDMDTEKL